MTRDTTTPDESAPDEDMLRAIEALALDLARETGQIATAGLAREIEVDYKTESQVEGQAPRDPVSEIDREIETLIRERVGERFPGHDIIGEEVELHPTDTDGYVWVIDPVDGTANFVNGYPLFCVSIGILHDGKPVVGAIWCSSTHALHPGVYHAHRGGGLHFDAEPFEPIHAPGVRRKLSAAPGGSPGRARDWDNRVTGSAAIELAFVAAGIFQSARFGGLHIWDLAAGVLLIQEAGGQTLIRRDGELGPLERFEAPAEVKEDRAPSLRDWRGLVVVGTDAAIEVIRETTKRPGWLARLGSRFGRKRRR
jgi:myo-inositol-1(or 4)-monophosphatase